VAALTAFRQRLWHTRSGARVDTVVTLTSEVRRLTEEAKRLIEEAKRLVEPVRQQARATSEIATHLHTAIHEINTKLSILVARQDLREELQEVSGEFRTHKEERKQSIVIAVFREFTHASLAAQVIIGLAFATVTLGPIGILIAHMLVAHKIDH
jgi:signal transduction histidine kinase